MVDAQLLEVRGQVDGLAADIRTMHERLDLTVTSTIERFNQLDLAQTVTRTTLETILARLDALTTKMDRTTAVTLSRTMEIAVVMHAV